VLRIVDSIVRQIIDHCVRLCVCAFVSAAGTSSQCGGRPMSTRRCTKTRKSQNKGFTVIWCSMIDTWMAHGWHMKQGRAG
jgi:hypothetical protein